LVYNNIYDIILNYNTTFIVKTAFFMEKFKYYYYN